MEVKYLHHVISLSLFTLKNVNRGYRFYEGEISCHGSASVYTMMN